MPIVAIAGVVIALVALLLLVAGEQIAKALGSLLPTWHLVGLGSIADWWAGRIGSLRNWVAGYLGQALEPVAKMIAWPIIWVMRKWQAILNFSFHVGHTLGWLIRQAVPYYLNALKHFTLYYYYQATSYTDARTAALTDRITYYYDAAVRYTDAQVAALDHLISYVGSQAKAYTDAIGAYTLTQVHALDVAVTAAITSTRAEASALVTYAYTHAISYADALAGAIRSEAISYYRAALAYCDAKVAQVVAAAVGNEHVLLGQALAAVWPRVKAEADAAIAVADKDFTAVVDDLRSLSGVNVSNPAAVAAATATGLAAMVRLARDCVMPNCRNLSQVGRDLQGLFGVVEDGLILAFIAEAAHNPEGLGREVTTTVGPVLTDAADLVLSQAGI